MDSSHHEHTGAYMFQLSALVCRRDFEMYLTREIIYHNRVKEYVGSEVRKRTG